MEIAENLIVELLLDIHLKSNDNIVIYSIKYELD